MHKERDICIGDGTFIFDGEVDWLQHKTCSFIFKFVNNHNIKINIKLIAKMRENALNYISNFLNINSDFNFTIYILPSIKFANSFGFPYNCSFPHHNIACIIYDEFPFCREKIACGHEITHLVSYYWDEEIYHLELLEEGLATYLDFSGTNHHLNFLKKLKHKLTHENIDLSLKVSSFSYNTDYEKAGSFVKFLIENYGMEKFKELYTGSKLDRKGSIYYNGKNKLDEKFLNRLFKRAYKKKSEDIQKEWLENLGILL